MKNIIIIFFLLSSITTLAQKDVIHGKYNYADTLQLSKYKNNFAGDSVLTTDTLGKIHMKFIQPGNGSGIKKVGDPTLGLLVPNDSTYILDTARHADTAKTGLLSNIDYKKFNSAYYSFVQAPDSSNIPFKKLDGTPDDTLVVVNVGGSGGTIDSRPYKVYTALISQSSTSDPTVYSILENTLGATITLTRISTGWYDVTCSSALFNIAKLAVFIGQTAVSPPAIFEWTPNGTSDFYLFSHDLTDTGVDGKYIKTPIEIRVYN